MTLMLRVAAYTGGADVPSARFRVRQYVPKIRNAGVALTEHASWSGNYPPSVRWKRPGWALARLTEAGARAPASRRYDLVLFQRELLSTFVTVERLYERPRILDVDDAIWLHRRGSFALRLAKLCDAVICGNDYLAEYFSASGRDVYVLPTAVDAGRFVPQKNSSNEPPVIGWSGSGGNLRFLENIEPCLAVVMERFPEVRLRVVCNQPPKLPGLPSGRVDFVRWSPEVEVSALQDLHVGLMPLKDSEWSRGKCAFKMLTYMACGIPVVASPVGMNREVLAKGEIGLGPRGCTEWVDAVTSLLERPGQARRMGATARSVVERYYSADILGSRLAVIIKTVANAARGGWQ